MSEQTVVVSDHDFATLDIERGVLADIAEVYDADTDFNESNVDESLMDADAVLNLRCDIDRTLLAQMDDCCIVARYGVGVDNVDLKAATDHDIYVTNVPDYCQEEVATHALSLLVALYRGVTRYNASVATGEWERTVSAPIRRLSTQTLGIVGFGAIGQELAARSRAFGFDLLTSDPFIDKKTANEHGATLVPFEQLLERSDAVSIHSPLTEQTYRLFDDNAFDRMRESAFLVNVARGPIIDGEALVRAIESEAIRGVALDVFPDEPPAKNHILRDHERVVTTPHVAWYSEEANDERRRKAAENVKAALCGKRPPNAINGDAIVETET